MGGCGVVTVMGGVQRVGEIEPCLMRWQSRLATGRLRLEDPQRRPKDEMSLMVEGVVDGAEWMLSKRWVDRGDLNSCILRSRRRTI
jgi:hypothetical protein